MTQPNDEYHLSQSPPRNEYQLSDTDRINSLESSVASFNHMVVLLNERLDALASTRHEAAIVEPMPNVAVNLNSRIQNVGHSQNLLVSQVEAVRKHQKDHDDTVAVEMYDIRNKAKKLHDQFVDFMLHDHDPSPMDPRGPGSVDALVTTGPDTSNMQREITSLHHLTFYINKDLRKLHAAFPLLFNDQAKGEFSVDAIDKEFTDFVEGVRRIGQGREPVTLEAMPAKEAPVVTGPLPSRTYMDQIKNSLKIIEKECDILKHLWRQP